MDFRERYKRVGFGREDIEINRALRSQRRDELRREMRSEHFNLRRCIENNAKDNFEQEHEKANGRILTSKNPEQEINNKPTTDLKVAVQKRTLQLKKWCEERNRRRIQEKKQAKPVFKVGVVHHRVYSPPLIKSSVHVPEPKLCKSKETHVESLPKRITRATEKRLAIKAVSDQQKCENMKPKKIIVKSKKSELQTISLIPKNHQFKPPPGITPLPMFGRQATEEDANENMKSFVNATNPSYNKNEFLKSLSNNCTELFSLSTINPLIFPKFNNNQSITANTNLRKLNVDLCNQSIKRCNDSLNDSSVELASLRISSNDEEILYDERNVDIDCKKSSNRIKNTRCVSRSFENKTQSSKIVVPDVFLDAQATEYFHKDQEIMKKQYNIDLKLSIKNKMINEKSDTILKNGNTSFNKSTRDNKFILDKKKINIQKNFNSDHNNTKYPLNFDILKEKHTKSLKNKKRFSRISNNGNLSLNNIKKENSFLVNEKILDNSTNFIENSSMMDFTNLEQNKVEIYRKSTRASFNTTTEPLNLFSISEPKRKQISEKQGENSQNLCLNLLVNNSTPDKPPAFFSPHIVISRGKSSIRKEVQRRRLSQFSPNEIPTKDTIMQNLNISAKEEEQTAQYYKYILSQEIDRLDERCKIWNTIKENNVTPEQICYEIQVAVGQTKLLINKKFERFRSLVLDCETGKGEMLVTCKDLQGFWDMMYMEIKDCDNRFNKLEKLKQNKWKEEMEDLKNIQKLKKKKISSMKKSVNKKNTVTTKFSSLRAHIMAARKKKIDSKDTDVEIQINKPVNKHKKISTCKDVEPQNLSIKHVKKNICEISNTKSSNNWQPILKELSQKQKSTSSPLIVMKLSQMCKTPEIYLDNSIVYINSDRTPAKSILKSSKDDLTLSTGKSSNKVFFKERPIEFQVIENNNESNKNNNLNVEKTGNNNEPIERKLNFESDSFNSSFIEDEEEKNNIINLVISESNSEKNTLNEYPAIPNNNLPTKYLAMTKIIENVDNPMISMSSLILMKNKAEDFKKKETKMKKQISFKEDIKECYSRNLRSRKFLVPVTPKSNLRNSIQQINEDSSTEDNSIQKNKEDSPFCLQQKNQLKELYLNSDGIICQRTVLKKKDVSNALKLKRNSSEKTMKSSKVPKINFVYKTPEQKINSRNSCIPMVVLDNLITPIVKMANDNKSLSTPRIQRRNLIKLVANAKLREENINSTVDEIKKLKFNRRTTKIFNKVEDKIKNDCEKNKLGINSTPINVQLSLNTISKQVLTPCLSTKNSMTLEENIEPVLQENDQKTYESFNMSRTSGSKKQTSKEFIKNFKYNEQQSIIHETICDISIPSRRKSLRIARATND